VDNLTCTRNITSEYSPHKNLDNENVLFLKIGPIKSELRDNFSRQHIIDYFFDICRKHINAVQKSKSHSGANDLSVIVINNRKCHEKCVLFAPQWFFHF
jgi:hypothetical protein